MRRNSRRPSKFCAAPWTKIDLSATSSYHEPDRSVGLRSARNDHESEKLPKKEACKNWLASLAYNAVEVMIPEIADYEVRRELKAAEFWATTRKLGRQSADDASLDADMFPSLRPGLLTVTVTKQ